MIARRLTLIGSALALTLALIFGMLMAGGTFDDGSASGGCGGTTGGAQLVGATSGAASGAVSAEVQGQIAPSGTQRTMAIDAEQQANINTIVGVVKGQNLPLRVAVLAVATAMQESGLKVIDYGDAAGPDSRGLFQQRAAWGPYDARMDPVQSTLMFLNGGAKGQAGLLSTNWQFKSLEAAIVAVQVSVGGYAKWEVQAEQLVDAASGVDPITATTGTVNTVALTSSCAAADGAAFADGAVIPPGLVTKTTGWPPQTRSIPDPTGTGGTVTQRLIDVINALTAGGYTDGGISCWDQHAWNPTSDHPLGKACDVMFAYPDPVAIAHGWAAANYLIAHQAELGVKYLIWQGLYWDAADPTHWVTYQSDIYGCPNPAEVTGCHYDHVHVSVY